MLTTLQLTPTECFDPLFRCWHQTHIRRRFACSASRECDSRVAKPFPWEHQSTPLSAFRLLIEIAFSRPFCGLLSGDVTRMPYWFLNHFPITFRRLEGRDKYTRSKSPNIFNRKTIEVSTPAAPKSGASEPKPQRARTASMPAENRKVRRGKRSIRGANRKAIIHLILLSTGGLRPCRWTEIIAAILNTAES